jgi:hypothetical protein
MRQSTARHDRRLEPELKSASQSDRNDSREPSDEGTRVKDEIADREGREIANANEREQRRSETVAPFIFVRTAGLADSSTINLVREAAIAARLLARAARLGRRHVGVNRTLHAGECIVDRVPAMSLDTLRLLEHVHGHLGWLAAALLVHPAIVLRNRKRRAHLAVGLSTGAVTIGSAIGAWLYVAYREKLKQQIFIHATSIGLLFERKEHLAFGAVALAWIGCIAYFAAGRTTTTTDLNATLRTIAFRAYVAAAALSILVAVLGTIVAVYKSF